MTVNYAKFNWVGSLDADFQQVSCFKISQLFTVLLWNIDDLKSIKKSKKIISYFFPPKIQFTIEIALGQTHYGYKVNICKQSREIEKTNGF